MERARKYIVRTLGPGQYHLSPQVALVPNLVMEIFKTGCGYRWVDICFELGKTIEDLTALKKPGEFSSRSNK